MSSIGEAMKLEGWAAKQMKDLAEALSLKKPLVIFDVESTGPFPEIDRIIQIGWIRIEPDGTSHEKQLDIDPETSISAEATKIHSITNEAIKGKPKFRDVVEKIIEDFDGADLGGYNVRFDMTMLRAEFKRCGAKMEKVENIIDAYKIYVEMYPRTLEAAYEEYLGEPMQNAHEAIMDTRATAVIFGQQLRRHSVLEKTVEGLHARYNTAPEGYVDAERKLTLRDGEPMITFGKHKGKKLSEIPQDYREWMLKQDFSEAVKDALRKSIK